MFRKLVPALVVATSHGFQPRSCHATTKALLIQPRSFHTTTTVMAAPGITIASQTEVEDALDNPSATLVDARTVEEMKDSGFVDNQSCRFVFAPATKTEAPVLEVAARALIPSQTDPVVIYCGSGIRAATSKSVLENMGYTNVLNAGGLSDVEYLKD